MISAFFASFAEFFAIWGTTFFRWISGAGGGTGGGLIFNSSPSSLRSTSSSLSATVTVPPPLDKSRYSSLTHSSGKRTSWPVWINLALLISFNSRSSLAIRSTSSWRSRPVNLATTEEYMVSPDDILYAAKRLPLESALTNNGSLTLRGCNSKPSLNQSQGISTTSPILRERPWFLSLLCRMRCLAPIFLFANTPEIKLTVSHR